MIVLCSVSWSWWNVLSLNESTTAPPLLNVYIYIYIFLYEHSRKSPWRKLVSRKFCVFGRFLRAHTHARTLTPPPPNGSLRAQFRGRVAAGSAENRAREEKARSGGRHVRRYDPGAGYAREMRKVAYRTRWRKEPRIWTSPFWREEGGSGCGYLCILDSLWLAVKLYLVVLFFHYLKKYVSS